MSDKLRKLREKYAAQLPEKIGQIEKDWSALCEGAGNAESADALLRAVHTLSGSSISFGFRKVSAESKSLESELRAVVDKGSRMEDLSSVPVAEYVRRMLSACVQDRDVDNEDDISDVSADHEASAENPKTVFIAEDDVDLLESLIIQISHFGYEVKGFPEISLLMEEMKLKEPSVIIMDMVFPGGTSVGAETMKEIQQGRETKIPVIFISVRNDFDARLQAVRAGADAYFVKPVNVGILIDKLDAITKKEVVEPYRILIIDDDVDLSAFYSIILEEAGMVTSVVNKPEEGIAAIQKFNPDLILMDIYMPVCNGQELARIIRSMDTYVSVPIVFLSSETNLGKQLSAMRTGGDDFLTKPIQAGHLISSVTTRAERMRIIRSFMDRDSLTGLLNHTKTKEQLDFNMERIQRHGGSLVLAMIDIDNFKMINDTYGHHAGDRVIVSLARLLQQRLRKIDIVGRYGGEEFAVILSDIDAAFAAKVMDAFRLSFSKIKHRVEGREFSVTFSCGLASSQAYGDPLALSIAADKALYEAKESGRNRIVLK